MFQGLKLFQKHFNQFQFYNQVRTLEVKLIQKENYEDVILHLRKFFFADEPLNDSVQLCKPGEGNAELEKNCIRTLDDNLSFMAVSKEEHQVAGVLLNALIKPGDLEADLEELKKRKDEKFQKIFKLILTQSLKTDLFKEFNVDKIIDLKMLSVDTEFRGHGVAHELVEATINNAKKNNIKLMRADCTGVISQKILKSYGFKVYSEIFYDKYVDAHGTVLPVKPPHVSLQLMIRET